jgi:hypothetical protein
MKSLKKVSIALLVLGMTVAFAQDSNSDNHKVSIVIPQIALLDIEPEASKDISLSLDAPTEAGDPLAEKSDNNLWLNVTSIVSSGATRDISVKVDAALTGIDLKVVSAAYSGAGFGSFGTPQPEVTLSTSDQALVSGIKSGYTADGDGNGFNLTYTASPKADSEFGDLVSTTGTDITVTYTLTP